MKKPCLRTYPPDRNSAGLNLNSARPVCEEGTLNLGSASASWNWTSPALHSVRPTPKQGDPKFGLGQRALEVGQPTVRLGHPSPGLGVA